MGSVLRLLFLFDALWPYCRKGLAKGKKNFASGERTSKSWEVDKRRISKDKSTIVIKRKTS